MNNAVFYYYLFSLTFVSSYIVPLLGNMCLLIGEAAVLPTMTSISPPANANTSSSQSTRDNAVDLGWNVSPWIKYHRRVKMAEVKALDHVLRHQI